MNGKQRTQISGFPGGALGFDCSGSSPAVVPSVQAISRQMDEPAQFRDVYEKTLEEVGFMTLKKGNLTYDSTTPALNTYTLQGMAACSGYLTFGNDHDYFFIVN